MDELPAALLSISAQINALEVGQSYSRSERLDLDATSKERFAAVLNFLRVSLETAARRATTNGRNRKYTVESGQWHTRNKDIVVTAICTRIS